MSCYLVRDGDGVAFLCGDIELEVCADCGFVADNLCDFPVGEEKTCDRNICSKHSNEVSPNVHYCDAHYREWRRFVDAGGVDRRLKNVIHFGREKQKTSTEPISVGPLVLCWSPTRST